MKKQYIQADTDTTKNLNPSSVRTKKTRLPAENSVEASTELAAELAAAKPESLVAESAETLQKPARKPRAKKAKSQADEKKVYMRVQPELPVSAPPSAEEDDEENDEALDLEDMAEELDDNLVIDLDDDTFSDEQKANPFALNADPLSLPAVAVSHLPSPLIRDNLHLYLREVGRFPLLAAEEEFRLAHQVRDGGDSDAAFRLISSHLRLVVKIAMDFQRRWMQNVLDLIQEGNVGLMRAVNKFDPDKGIKFSYYATFWIKAYILKFIMDNWRMVKIGTTQAQRKLFYNLNKERQKLIAEGFDPDAAALSERLGVTIDQVVEMQQRLDAGDVSLDIPIGDDTGTATRMDFLPALGPGIEDSYASSEIAQLVQDGVQELLPSLSEKEAYILEHRLLTDDPVTLREIGERYNVTRERIRQLEARLLTKLKVHLHSEIKDFSDAWISRS